MNIKQLFRKCSNRLAWEGMLKALLSGLIVGFSVNFVVASVTWFLEAKGLWVSIGSWLLISGGAAAIFYQLRYKPDKDYIARRLDRLGLQERMITMNEFAEDTSTIAAIQREDAMNIVNKLNVKAIRFVIPKVSIVLASAIAFCGIGMTVVTGLSDAGIIKSGKEFIEDTAPGIADIIYPPAETVTITYLIEDGEGAIEGDEVQILEKGEKGANASPVVAVADEGWMFVEWSDGVKDPAREDMRIMEDTTIYATFAPIGDGEGDGEPQPGEGEPGEGDEPAPPSDAKEEAPPQDGANGVYEENNMVLDGETYYRDIFEVYYQEAMARLESGEEIPDELRKLIQTYFDVIL